MRTSSRTAAKSASRSRLIASSPEPARTRGSPSSCRTASSASRLAGWSSTSRIGAGRRAVTARRYYKCRACASEKTPSSRDAAAIARMACRAQHPRPRNIMPECTSCSGPNEHGRALGTAGGPGAGDRDGGRARQASERGRAQPDRSARRVQAAQAGGPVREPLAAERFLDMRAQRVLQTVADRNPAIASLQDVPASRYWLLVATPLATLVLGALTERIADPHRVDLLSLPLLAIVLWNLLVYLLLVASWILPRRRKREHPLRDAVARWAAGLRRMAPPLRPFAGRRDGAVLPALAQGDFILATAAGDRGAAPGGAGMGRRGGHVAAGARPGGAVPGRLGKHLPGRPPGARDLEFPADARGGAVPVRAFLGAGSGRLAARSRRHRPRRSPLGVDVRGPVAGGGDRAPRHSGDDRFLARQIAGPARAGRSSRALFPAARLAADAGARAAGPVDAPRRRPGGAIARPGPGAGRRPHADQLGAWRRAAFCGSVGSRGAGSGG